MRVLIVDPRCTDGSNLYHYTMGLAEGISEYAETEVVCVSKCTVESNKKYKVLRLFYPISQRLKRTIFRQVLRGLEYILAYILIWVLTLFRQYDVIHIEWPIVFKLDSVFFKMLKKHCRILSLKAHNVLPHSTGDKYLNDFDRIYSIPDVVLVHGEGIKKEFIEKFPKYITKVHIQRHGTFLNQKSKVNETIIPDKIKKMISSCKRIYLFIGRIDQDKGVDRLVDIWGDTFKCSESLLVIAGEVSSEYKDFIKVESKIKKCSNILFMPGFVEDNILCYLLSNCNLIILPYVKGSMSGVAFTAAAYGCPILSTKFGSIEEYITDGFDGFLVSNDDKQLSNKLSEVEIRYTNEELKKIGENMSVSFSTKYRWTAIGDKLVNCTYAALLNKNQ